MDKFANGQVVWFFLDDLFPVCGVFIDMYPHDICVVEYDGQHCFPGKAFSFEEEAINYKIDLIKKKISRKEKAISDLKEDIAKLEARV